MRFFDNINEMVMDEGKCVVYSSFSSAFGIHVNVAKELLYEYAMKLKSDVNITYLISGVLHDNKGYKIKVCREEDVLEFKSQLQQIISEHIYSIQKSRIPDLNVLYDFDKPASRLSKEKKGPITYKNAIMRKDVNVAINPPETVAEQKVSLSKQIKKNDSESKAEDIDEINDVDKKPVAKVLEQAKSKTIATIFSALSKKEKPSNNEVEKKSSGSISALFYKQAEKPKDKTCNDSQIIKDITPTSDHVLEQQISPDSSNKTVKEMTIRKTSKKCKKKSTKSESSKKRKRIMVMSDSDSDDPFEDLEADVEMPQAQPQFEEPIPQPGDDDDDIIPSTPVQQVNKQIREQKLVSKTYKDEDGFFVTTKVYETVSTNVDGSEENESASPVFTSDNQKIKEDSPSDIGEANDKSIVDQVKKKPSKQPAKKTKVSPPTSGQKMTQKSIMSFFSKPK